MLYSLGMCSGHHQQFSERQIKSYMFGQKDAMQDTLRQLYVWSPFIMQLNSIYCEHHRCSSYCTVHRHSAAAGSPRNVVSIYLVLQKIILSSFKEFCMGGSKGEKCAYKTSKLNKVMHGLFKHHHLECVNITRDCKQLNTARFQFFDFILKWLAQTNYLSC